jgi:hypothetical protein
LSNRNENRNRKNLTVEEAGKRGGGQKVKKLVEEGKEHEKE